VRALVNQSFAAFTGVAFGGTGPSRSVSVAISSAGRVKPT
jgi:hypothetical protein